MKLEDDAGGTVITAERYRLRVDAAAASAELSDPDGRCWTRLTLLASLDRTDVADESFAIEAPRVTATVVDGEEAVEVAVAASSSAWQDKVVRVRCFADRVEVDASVTGAGSLANASLLGGSAVLGSGASGRFFSSIGFEALFVPTPTEPVHVVRPAGTPAVLGVVGDASPGRLHAVFSPPPLLFGFGRAPAGLGTDIPEGEWLTASLVAGVDDLTCTEFRYEPVDGGFRLVLDYDGHTEVRGTFRTPTLVLRPAADPWAGLARYRADHVERDLVASPGSRAEWWSEPIFCGWGAQCARARGGTVPASDLCAQPLYDEWLARLAGAGVVPGTIVIDDRWQRAYGTGEPDPDRWSDLRAWIAARHAVGQRVLLWWKAWDPEGLPPDECVLDPAGRPVTADPGNPAYRARLAGIVTRLLGPAGIGADGFKIDFTQRGPAGALLRRPGAEPGSPWGIAAVHQLLATIHAAAKAAKRDALLVTHTPHPGFAGVSDMIRLNDVLERDVTGAPVPAAAQLAFRHAVVGAVLPEHLIDTDQWPMGDRAQWRDYVVAQARLGVPALYYAERIDGSGEELTADDLALVARTWAQYRAGRP